MQVTRKQAVAKIQECGQADGKAKVTVVPEVERAIEVVDSNNPDGGWTVLTYKAALRAYVTGFKTGANS